VLLKRLSRNNNKTSGTIIRSLTLVKFNYFFCAKSLNFAQK
jgi:hypothetical protein